MREPVRLPVVQNDRPHLSFSELQVWERCQWRWHLEKQLEVGEKAEGFDLIYGTAAHHAMELLFREKLPVGDVIAGFDRKLDEGMDALTLSLPPGKTPTDGLYKRGKPQKKRDEYDRMSLDEQLWLDVDAFEKFRMASRRFIPDVIRLPELRDAEVLASELDLYEEVLRTDGLRKNFKGFVDMFVAVPKRRGKGRTLLLLDFKTCSWGWMASKRNDPMVQAQLHLYKHFLCRRFGTDPTTVQTAFVLLKKSAPEAAMAAEYVSISAGPKSVARAVEMLQRAITGMHSDVLERDHGRCQMRLDSGKLAGWGDCPFLETEHCPTSRRLPE